MKKLSALVITLFLLAAPGRLPAQTTGQAPAQPRERGPFAISLLNVNFGNGERSTTPAATGAGAAQPAENTICRSGLTEEQLKERLHRGGKKRALVVRGGNFGVHPEIVKIIQRAAKSLAFYPEVKDFLEKELQREYISDDTEVIEKLKGMGYEVRHLTSRDYASKLERFKPDILEELGRAETTVMVYYGHGGPDDMYILDARENRVPWLEGVVRAPEAAHPQVTISAAELKAAVTGRGGLDALIMHGCQNGTRSYRKERKGHDVPGVTFAETVKKDEGFFSGWVTYSVYLRPETLPILQKFFCHVASWGGRATEESRKTSRHYIRASGLAHKMAEIAFGNDGSELPRAELEGDAEITGHAVEYMSRCEPVKNVIELVHDLKHTRAEPGAAVRGFLMKHTMYCLRKGVPLAPGVRTMPRFSVPPTTDELNKILNDYSRPLMQEIFDIVSPGLVKIQEQKLTLDSENHLFVDLKFKLSSSQEIEKALKIVGDATDPGVRRTLTGGVGEHLGAQLADRIRDAIARGREALGDDLAEVRIQLSLEKVDELDDKKQKTGRFRIQPWVYRYHIAVGEIPASLMEPKDPYEIHIAVGVIDKMVRKTLDTMLSGEVELKYTKQIDYFPDLSVYAYLSLRSDRQGPVREANGGLSTKSVWQLRVNWPTVGHERGFTDTWVPVPYIYPVIRIVPGYAYAESDIGLKVEPAGDLKVKFDPSLQVKLTGGWGPIDSPVLRTLVTAKINEVANKVLKGKLSEPVDFARFIPEANRGDVVGKVKIRSIEVRDGVLSIRLAHP